MSLKHSEHTIHLGPEHTKLFGAALDRYQNTSHPCLAAAMAESHAFSYGLASNDATEPQVVSMDEGEVARRTNPDEDVYNMAFSVISGLWKDAQSDSRKPTMEIGIGNESAMASYVTLALADELLCRLYPAGGQKRKPLLPHKRLEHRALVARYRESSSLRGEIYAINRRYLRRGVNGGWVNKVTTPELAVARLINIGTISQPPTDEN